MIKRHTYWLIYILFTFACAKQSAPTGGPKDTIPPKLIRTIPANESTNFKGQIIELEFSEMVDGSAAKEQLIITPTIGKDFEVRTKRNSIVLDLKRPLKENTTYSFNFRESIKDVTEKNPARKLQLALSTGTYIDSLSISGTITDILIGKQTKDATVALHEPNDTFNILKHPATIITRTDEKGNFRIDYLKPGQYFLYAFEDKNKNLIVDSRSESYGFLNHAIDLKKDTSQIPLGVVRLDARPLRITSARPYNTYYNIKTTKNIKNFSLSAHTSAALYSTFGEDHSNIRVYPNTATSDSIAFSLIALDSIGNKIDTTLFAKFLSRETTPEKFSAEVDKSKILAEKGQLYVSLKFNKPIKQVNFDSLFYAIDSTQKISFTHLDLKWNTEENKVVISKKVDKKLFALKTTPTTSAKDVAKASDAPKKSKSGPDNKKTVLQNQLIVGKATFISVDNDSSKKITQPIIPQQIEDLSIIVYDIRTKQKDILIQLLDKNHNILQQHEDQPKGQFEDLPAGQYLMRVIIDSNNNNSWDPGNYFTREEPERLYYYKGGEKGEFEINLKTNWELVLSPMLVTY